MFDVVYGCMSRTPCVHHALRRPLLVLTDSIGTCRLAPRGVREFRHFKERMKAGMHNKAFELLTQLRGSFDARYYVKIDTDVDTSNVNTFESRLKALRADYYGVCVTTFMLRHADTGALTPYAQGGTYALSNRSMRLVVSGYRSMVHRWHSLFTTPGGNRRRIDEDAVTGAILWFARVNLTCAARTMRHGCKRCDYS